MHGYSGQMKASCQISRRAAQSLLPVQQRSVRSHVPFRSIVKQRRGAKGQHLHRRKAVTYAGLLDLLRPAAGKTSGQAQELVDELLELARGTNGGARASSATREQLEDLAGQLQSFRPRAPVRSPLFQGTYQVLYTSNPKAPGGPVLRSGPGQAVFAGQELRQSIGEGGVFQNEVGFKTLGLFPGTAVQEGRWRPLDGNRYVVDLEPASLSVGGGAGVSQPGESVQRTFEVLYLDERARIVRFLPEPDSGGAPQLFVFERIAEEEDKEEEEEEADEEEEEEEQEQQTGGFGFLRGLSGAARGEGLATQAERSAREAAPAPSRAQRRGKAAQQAPREQSEEARQREAVRAQLAAVTDAYKQAQAQSRDAAKELKNFERSAAQARREAGPALERVRLAEATEETADAQLQAAREAAAQADEEVKAASDAIRELQLAGRD